MKLISKIEYRKDVPASADACVSDPYGNPNASFAGSNKSDPADSTPGLSWEGIGRELKRNSWQSNLIAHTSGDDDQLSMKNMIDGDEFYPDEYIRTGYGPYPDGNSYAASEWFDYNHYVYTPPPVTTSPPTPQFTVIPPPTPPPPPPAPPPGPPNFNDPGDFYNARSDKRWKADIEMVGHSPSGLPIYEWNYISKLATPGRYRGTIAQDLIKHNRTDATTMDRNGYLYVDYNKIDIEFGKIIDEI